MYNCYPVTNLSVFRFHFFTAIVWREVLRQMWRYPTRWKELRTDAKVSDQIGRTQNRCQGIRPDGKTSEQIWGYLRVFVLSVKYIMILHRYVCVYKVCLTYIQVMQQKYNIRRFIKRKGNHLYFPVACNLVTTGPFPVYLPVYCML